MTAFGPPFNRSFHAFSLNCTQLATSYVTQAVTGWVQPKVCVSSVFPLRILMSDALFLGGIEYERLAWSKFEIAIFWRKTRPF